MAYQSLYRRFRPGRFDEIIGQDHLVRALRNAARDDRVGHAYLLSGPRGTGKTTAARVLAKVLNCEHPSEGEPDCECESCKAIEEGRSFDLHELDAASHNKVDDVRDLLAKVALGTPGRTKVYLLDEVHMLTAGAENALLKTLEEPPDHVVFVLATTEPHKVVETIRSRTQHLELNLVGADEMTEHVFRVAELAELDIADEDVAHVVEVGRGSVRDTLSALDRVVAAGGRGSVDDGHGELIDALAAGEPGAVLAAVAQSVQAGTDVRVVAERLVASMRDAFLVALGGPTPQLGDAARVAAAETANALRPAKITNILDLVGTALVDMRQSPDPRIDLEVALVRAARPAGGDDGGGGERIAELEGRVAQLEARIADRAVAAAATDAPEPSAPAPPEPPASSGPVAKARKRLAQSKGARQRSEASDEPAAPPPASRSKAPTTDDAAAVDDAPSATDDPSPPSDQTPTGTTAPVLDLDALNAQWSESVLGTLSNKARARLQAGRFVSVGDGTAEYALPNDIHRKRCEELLDEVHEAIAAQLGGAVRLTLTVADGERPSRVSEPETGEGTASGGATEADDDAVDLTDLTDADDSEGSLLEQVTKAFPGAEVVDSE